MKQSNEKGEKNTRKPSTREDLYVEGRMQGKSKRKAALGAGYAMSTANSTIYKKHEEARIQERIQQRIRESQIDTKEITGTLVSHMRADPAELFPDDKFLRQAQERGVSHLIKELEITEREIPAEVDEEGKVVKPAAVERKYKIKVHDSQSAAKSLANIHGLEKLAGANPADVEREKSNREWAEQQLADFRRDFPALNEVEAKELIKTQAPNVYKWLN